MLIPYIQERQKLLALHQELIAVREQEERELASLRANLDEVRRRVEIEFEAAGGVTLDKQLGENAIEVKDPDRQRRLVEERHEKEIPAREAYQAARAVFEQRAHAIRKKIEAAEKALGAELAVNYWRGSGRAFCAITGQPILTSDRIAVVLADALPDTAIMKESAWVIDEG